MNTDIISLGTKFRNEPPEITVNAYSGGIGFPFEDARKLAHAILEACDIEENAPDIPEGIVLNEHANALQKYIHLLRELVDLTADEAAVLLNEPADITQYRFHQNSGVMRYDLKMVRTLKQAYEFLSQEYNLSDFLRGDYDGLSRITWLQQELGGA